MTKKNLLFRLVISLLLIVLLAFQIYYSIDFFKYVKGMKVEAEMLEAQSFYEEIKRTYIDVRDTWIVVLLSALANFVVILYLTIPLFYGKLKDQAKATVAKMKEDAERNKEKRKQKEIEDKKSQIESLKKQIEEMEKTE